MSRICVAAAVAVTALNGCVQNAPTCSQPETVALVLQIAGEHRSVAMLQKIHNATLSLDAIRTVETNRQTGAHSCEAEFLIASVRFNQKFDITYKSELTDDNRHYVTVFDL